MDSEAEEEEDEEEEDTGVFFAVAKEGVLVAPRAVACAGVLAVVAAGVLLVPLACTTDALSSKSISAMGWKLAVMLGVGTV